LRAFEAGEQAAFGELVRRYEESVFKLVRRYAVSTDDARDVTQRVFLQALEAARRTLPRFLARGEELPFKAWLFRIAINVGKNHVRDGSRWLRAPLEAAVERPQPTPDAQARLERAEAERRVRQAVLQLPRRQREVFALRVDAGLSFAEVAAALGITEGNAKAHFHYALKRLREVCAAEGAAP
jgi:RNA polymerase sigma-70 factor (ECF subfamily)